MQIGKCCFGKFAQNGTEEWRRLLPDNDLRFGIFFCQTPRIEMSGDSRVRDPFR